MKRLIILLLLLLVYHCSSEPCEDLKLKADSCLDESIKSLLLNIANKGDKQDCKDYLDSYYFSFFSRCEGPILDAKGEGPVDVTVYDASSL